MVGQADWLTKKERRVPTLSDAQWMAEQPQYAPEEAYMEEEWGVMMMMRRRRFRMMASEPFQIPSPKSQGLFAARAARYASVGNCKLGFATGSARRQHFGVRILVVAT